MEMDVAIEVSHGLVSAEEEGVTIACGYTDRERTLECDSLLLVTARLPDDAIVADLVERDGAPQAKAVGDAWSPGTIAAAVWDGRRYAEELDEPDEEPAVRREVVALAPR
jgi:dimethylamine/trimethylamine dehydrogenase